MPVPDGRLPPLRPTSRTTLGLTFSTICGFVSGFGGRGLWMVPPPPVSGGPGSADADAYFIAPPPARARAATPAAILTVVGRIRFLLVGTPAAGSLEHAASVRLRRRGDEAPKGLTYDREVQFD
jgi:hypothetical protein